MIAKASLPDFIGNTLGDLLDQPGGLLYSSHETLKPGPVYLLGLNPGGKGAPSLRQSLTNMLVREENAYLDEAWENEAGSWEAGEAPMQKRVSWLLGGLGQNLRDVCASNLIFVQSRDATGVDMGLAQRCWPVHEAIIGIVKPRLLLTFGNAGVSPYTFLHSLLGGEQVFRPSGHGTWSLKGFRSNVAGQSVFVAGLPHLSRYSPIGRTDVIEWLKSEAGI